MSFEILRLKVARSGIVTRQGIPMIKEPKLKKQLPIHENNTESYFQVSFVYDNIVKPSP